MTEDEEQRRYALLKVYQDHLEGVLNYMDNSLFEWAHKDREAARNWIVATLSKVDSEMMDIAEPKEGQ